MTRISDEHDYPRIYEITNPGLMKLFYLVSSPEATPVISCKRPAYGKSWPISMFHTEQLLLQQSKLQLKRIN